jgi:hypothetical protein
LLLSLAWQQQQHQQQQPAPSSLFECDNNNVLLLYIWQLRFCGAIIPCSPFIVAVVVVVCPNLYAYLAVHYTTSQQQEEHGMGRMMTLMVLIFDMLRLFGYNLPFGIVMFIIIELYDNLTFSKIFNYFVLLPYCLLLLWPDPDLSGQGSALPTITIRIIVLLLRLFLNFQLHRRY